MLEMVNKINLFDAITRDGFGLVTNLKSVVDCTLFKKNGEWTILFDAIDGTLPNRQGNIYQLILPAGEPLDSKNWRIASDLKNPTLALSVAKTPSMDSWDATGYHCISYVKGLDPATNEWKERLYYASSKEWTMVGPYYIGFLEWDGKEWIKYDEPVLKPREEWEGLSVLEPNVIYHDGKWKMWYSAGPTKDYKFILGYTESVDGKNNWSAPKTFSTLGTFDAAIVEHNNRFEMIMTRWPDNPEKPEESGLWWLNSDKASGAIEDWSKPVQLLRSNDVSSWHNGGTWKPTFQYDNGKMYVFFNASKEKRSPHGSIGIMIFKNIE